MITLPLTLNPRQSLAFRCNGRHRLILLVTSSSSKLNTFGVAGLCSHRLLIFPFVYLRCRATVAQEYAKFWVGIKSPVVNVVSRNIPIQPSYGITTRRPPYRPTAATYRPVQNNQIVSDLRGRAINTLSEFHVELIVYSSLAQSKGTTEWSDLYWLRWNKNMLWIPWRMCQYKVVSSGHRRNCSWRTLWIRNENHIRGQSKVCGRWSLWRCQDGWRFGDRMCSREWSNSSVLIVEYTTPKHWKYTSRCCKFQFSLKIQRSHYIESSPLEWVFPFIFHSISHKT